MHKHERHNQGVLNRFLAKVKLGKHPRIFYSIESVIRTHTAPITARGAWRVTVLRRLQAKNNSFLVGRSRSEGPAVCRHYRVLSAFVPWWLLSPLERSLAGLVGLEHNYKVVINESRVVKLSNIAAEYFRTCVWGVWASWCSWWVDVEIDFCQWLRSQKWYASNNSQDWRKGLDLMNSHQRDFFYGNRCFVP